MVSVLTVTCGMVGVAVRMGVAVNSGVAVSCGPLAVGCPPLLARAVRVRARSGVAVESAEPPGRLQAESATINKMDRTKVDFLLYMRSLLCLHSYYDIPLINIKEKFILLVLATNRTLVLG